MLDIVARILPVAATIAVASLSMFNVGYFWKIGLHFMGIVDFNNVVYTFGLTFLVWVVLALVGIKLVDVFLSQPTSELSIQRSKRTSQFLRWIGFSVFVLALLTPYFPASLRAYLHAFFTAKVSTYDLVRGGFLLVGCILFWGAQSFRSSLDYKTSGVAFAKADDLMGAILVPFVIFYLAGKLVADWEIVMPETYTIATIKGATIENARLLRASSVGFIIFAEERVVFLPQSQIAQIKATPQFIVKEANRPCPWGYTHSAPGDQCERIGN